MHAIAVSSVTRTYGDTTALDNVSLDVAAGEVFGLIGPNGAGKTTLVRALTGTTTPDTGEVRVLGEPPAVVARDRIGLLPQQFSPPARLTARELIRYYAGLYESARAVDDVLSLVGLLDAADTWYEKLSGGQQRRVCVGSALVNDPEVLFLDEPTTAIDPAGRRALWSVLEDLAAGGTTIFLTTHDMAEAEHLADRVGLLADGDLVALGAPADLIGTHGGAPHLDVDADASAVRDAVGDRFSVEDGPMHGVRIGGVAPTAIGSVVDALDAAGVEYDELTWSEPSLEDVYLELTGHTYERARVEVAR